MAVTVTVGRCIDDVGPLHPTIRPNFMHLGGVSSDLAIMLALPNLSLVRDSTMETLYGGDFYQALELISAAIDAKDLLSIGGSIDTHIRTGAPIYFSVDSSTASWMRPLQTPGTNAPSNTIPLDWVIYEEFWYQVGTLLLAKGVQPNRIYFSVRNEPDTGPAGSAGAFTGSLEDMVEQYAHFAHGIKRAHPEFRVGGLDFANPSGTLRKNDSGTYRQTDGAPGSGTILENGNYRQTIEHWLRGIGSPPKHLYGGLRIPLDFVSFHWFIDIPWLQSNKLVDEWLRHAGYDIAYVERILSESNLGLGNIPMFAGHIGAASICRRNQLLEEMGIDQTTYALLRNGTVAAPAGYDGGYGLYATATGGIQVSTTVKNVMTVFSLLGRRKIQATVSQDAYDAAITVTATAQGNERWVLISRACTRNADIDFGGGAGQNDSKEQFLYELLKQGFRSLRIDREEPFKSYTGMTYANVASYIANSFTPRATLPADILTMLANAKTRILAYQAVRNSNASCVFDVTDRSLVSKMTLYEIKNTATNNPKVAFDTEYAVASNFTNALNAAIAQTGALTSSFTGTKADLPYTLTLQPWHIVLIRLQGNGEPNDLPAGQAKPLDHRYTDFIRATY